jgi:hypothetical protein
MCRHHLGGDGVFTIDPSSPTNATLAGTIVNGTFNGGPGSVSLQLALPGTNPITVNLANARVKASISPTGTMTAVVGGLLLTEEINNNVIPVFYGQLAPLLESDCGPEAQRNLGAADCGCRAGSLGAGLLANVDIAPPKDCKVSLAEVQNVLAAFLMPDVCSKPSCAPGAADGLSVGIKVTTVKASFPGLQ